MHNGLVCNNGLNKADIVDVRWPSSPDGRFATCAPALVDTIRIGQQKAVAVGEHVELEASSSPYVCTFLIAAVNHQQ